jgi:hypothetical protein
MQGGGPSARPPNWQGIRPEALASAEVKGADLETAAYAPAVTHDLSLVHYHDGMGDEMNVGYDELQPPAHVSSTEEERGWLERNVPRQPSGGRSLTELLDDLELQWAQSRPIAEALRALRGQFTSPEDTRTIDDWARDHS